MDSISVNQFRDNLKDIIKKVISQHKPLKITNQNGADFIVISAEDWEREQETLYILQNSSLIQQIANSMVTHLQNQGYSPSSEEMDEILSI
ncbi:MAG TPA: type II toxin-antitoxin system Phd/YefM family antitoxin [Nostocaceae cyanobacterium]|nr:type II toxin-antitoxin system Phd/YefM family antitoxin [Nostocaceae cyanobacterium]